MTATRTTSQDHELVTVARGAGPDAAPAREELTRRYEGLVLATARRHHHDDGPDHDDVVSVGNVGLQKAIRDFDPTRDVPFAAYAAAKVRGEMLQWFRDDRYALRVSRPLHETFMQVRQVQAELRDSLGREPTVAGVARLLGVSEPTVIEALALNSAQRSRTDELTSVPHDGLSDVEAYGVIDLVDRLAERPRRLLYLRYWLGWSQQDVADDLGVSQGHVSRLERRALASARDALR